MVWQAALFLVALFFACREMISGSALSVLVVAAAAIPYYAYLQKLLYPDRLIASLVLSYALGDERVDRRRVPSLRWRPRPGDWMSHSES